MPKYILSPNAQKSLKKIRAYSINQFGKRQTNIYLKKLADRMVSLTKHPKLGKARDEIKEGYYSYFEGSHTIYYKIRNDHIAVIDILHQSMEPTIHLLQNSPLYNSTIALMQQNGETPSKNLGYCGYTFNRPKDLKLSHRIFGI